MRLSFTRGEGRRHQITAVGEDGRVGFYAMADYGAALPHDLAHVVVESLFDLPFGFWGLVGAGARFDTLNRAASGAEPVRRTDPIVEAHLDELLEAEALVNLFHEQQIAGRQDDDAYIEKANSLSEARRADPALDRDRGAGGPGPARPRRPERPLAGDTPRRDSPSGVPPGRRRRVTRGNVR